jgi:hypothetical protein
MMSFGHYTAARLDIELHDTTQLFCTFTLIGVAAFKFKVERIA